MLIIFFKQTQLIVTKLKSKLKDLYKVIMAYDGLLAKAVCEELNNKAIGSKIEKIYQPESDQIVIQIRTGDGRLKVLIDISSQGSRVQLTKNEFENPQEAPAFCMLLRKHIQGGRITGITQIDVERIIIFEIETVNEMGYSTVKKLVCETMGKYSNIILLDGINDKIIDSAKRISIDVNRFRQILPGLIYVQPPKAKLSNDLGYGPSTMVAVEMGSDPHRVIPTVWEDSLGNVKDVHVIDLCQYRNTYNEIVYDSMGDALDHYYNKKFETNRVYQKAASLTKQISGIINKLELKKSRLIDEIRKSDESEIYRIKGELINANLHLITPGSDKVDVINYYDGEKTVVELDKKLSPAKNAQAYFKKYSKLKSSKKEKLQQLNECTEELEYLNTVSAEVSLAENYSELDAIREELSSQGFVRGNKAEKRKNKTKPKPRKFLLSTGHTVLVGKSNTENDYITFKMSQKGDYWLHTKDIHGSHLLLQMGGDEPEAEDIYEAAAIAAWYSKGKDSDNVPVDYVPIRYVKKPGNARPGMVVFTNNKTVWVKPVKPSENN